MVMMVLANQILVFSNEYTDLRRAIWTSSYSKNKGCVLKVKQKALGYKQRAKYVPGYLGEIFNQTLVPSSKLMNKKKNPQIGRAHV